MNMDMEESIRYFTDMVDEVLQPILSETPFPRLEFRSAEEAAQKYHGVRRTRRFVQANLKDAYVRAFVGDIIWVNEDYFAGNNGPLDDYCIANRMIHEAVHARMTSRDRISGISDETLAYALTANIVVRTLNDGLCDYLAMSLIGTGDGTSSCEAAVNYNTHLMARVKLEESYLAGKPIRKLERDLKLFEGENIDSESKPYYFGAVFMHLMSRHLGKEEAIKLVKDPFKDGIPDVIYEGDESFLKCTMEDIMSPHSYVQARQS